MAKAAVANTDEKSKGSNSKKKVLITSDMNEQVVVMMDEDTSVELVFGEGDEFKELSDEAIEKLKHVSKRNYFISLGMKKQKDRQVDPVQVRLPKSVPLSPLMQVRADRESGIPERPGYRITWIAAGPSSRPANYIETCKSAGYVFCREISPDDPPEKAWEGKGEIIKIYEGQDDYTYAMYAPAKVQDDHALAMSYASRMRYSSEAVEAELAGIAEAANMDKRMNKGKERVTAIAETVPGQEIYRKTGFRKEDILPDREE